MSPRAIALIGAVCLTTGWLLASLLTPPVARLQALPELRSAPVPSVSETVAPFTEQLHLKLRQAPAPPVPRRNPFEFGTRQRASIVSAQPQVSAPLPEAPMPPTSVAPIFSLSGIGVNETPTGPVHTAVLSDGHTVHLVKAGEVIGGYKVIEVTETSITLADPAGAQSVLRLRD